ncbi:MAG TPA: tetratricopeptide repeat protein [Actinophytocola sp.]|nr:tetratricopeptide repeat protein [Actinophytocola sp.]
MSDERDRTDDDVPASELAAELRKLWAAAERARGAEIRVSAFAKEEAFLSPSSLYAYLAGTTVPTALVLDRILRALGVHGPALGHMADLREEAVSARQRAGRRRRNPVRPEPDSVPAPCQLPPDVRGFIGRAEQLAELDRLLVARERQPATTVALASGTPGVGKTALVTHWAHRVRNQFPDGMLYVDLRGFDPEQPLEPGQVLGTFLRGLGVSGDAIPAELAERTALFRARLDRRKVLVFLDNAASEDQVRPLLPNSPDSVVVVTSRNTLPGLVARDGAHLVPVPSLPVGEAVTLLRLLIGEERVVADQDGAAELVKRCALLPLAIRVGADLATTRRRERLIVLADELHRYHLDLFSAGGDERTAIRAVFSWSYLHLRADRARAFRLLGLHPGHDLDVYTCAALLDVELAAARLRIDDLVRANLLEHAGDQRYRMHDLLRAYAHEQTPRDEAEEAMHRLFDHYLSTSAAAMDLVIPDDHHSRPAIAMRASEHPLVSAEEAIAWLDAERRNLLTLAEVAANEDWPPVCATQMSALLCRYLHNRAHYADAMALHTLALKVARHRESAELEGWELARIGDVHLRLGHHVEALDHLEHALTIARQIGDPRLEARALRLLGQVCLRQGRHQDALALLRQALPLTRTVADRHLEGHVLSILGVVLDELGRHEEARTCHEAAVTVSQQVRDHDLAGHVLNNLGIHHQRIGDPEAHAYHRRALTIARLAANPGLEADSSLRLGVALRDLDRTEEARVALDNARSIAAGIGDRTVMAEVHRVLDTLGGPR